jgi:hypothetical protein
MKNNFGFVYPVKGSNTRREKDRKENGKREFELPHCKVFGRTMVSVICYD